MHTEHVPAQGVRKLRIEDQAPNCEILINGTLFRLEDVCRNKRVADIGCGYGANKPIVESVGGEWIGVEPFEGGAHTVTASAEDLPFEDNSFDVVIMHAVLEHIPNVAAAFSEVARILKPGGVFVGYVAFMECFHEISYSHLSHKALEHFSDINGMKLEKIAGGSRFGIDYHLSVLMFPLPFQWVRPLLASCIRGHIKIKSWAMYCGLRFARKRPTEEASRRSKLYYQVECLRQSNGFQYIIRKQ
jgi:SAM-dependent methyltransferase